MSKLITVIDRFNGIVHALLAIVLGFVSLLTIYQVFARYVLHHPLVWSEELTRYLMIWIVFLGGAIAVRQGVMISVEVVQILVPKLVVKLLMIVVSVLNIVLMIILIKHGFGIMANLSSQTTGAMDIPVSWTYAAIPVGACYTVLNSIVVLLEQVFTRKEVHHDDGAALL